MERNPDIPFTYAYSQPEEYHFSIDSIEMAWEVHQRILEKENDGQTGIGNWNCLDLCAGCGVIGFDLNFHNSNLKNWDFVEVQEIYKSHFENNLKLVQQKPTKPKLSLVSVSSSGTSSSASSSQGNFNFLNFNYEKLIDDENYHNKYQLIVCNPPYFQPGQGKMSPSEFKNRCRFFLDSSFERLIESIYQSLAMDGEAFLLVRDLEDHQIDMLAELRRFTKNKLKVESRGMIRGTFLIMLYK